MRAKRASRQGSHRWWHAMAFRRTRRPRRRYRRIRTRMRMRSKRKMPVNRRFVSRVKKAWIKLAEPMMKYRIVSMVSNKDTRATDNSEQLQNGVVKSWDAWHIGNHSLFPSMGTTEETRIGREIFTTQLRIVVTLNVLAGKKNSIFKFFWVEWNMTEGPPDGTGGTGGDSLFLKGFSLDANTDLIDRKRYTKVKYLGKIHEKDLALPVGVNADDGINVQRIFKVPFRKRIKFKASNSHVPVGISDYGTVVVVAYNRDEDSDGDLTKGTGNCAEFVISYRDI